MQICILLEALCGGKEKRPELEEDLIVKIDATGKAD